jgi:hypothetical protein
MKICYLFASARIWLFVCISLVATQGFAGSDTITGPYTKRNLSIFLIHGQDRIKDQNLLTLGEAMQKKMVKVYETSNVNQLSIENRSQDQYIYIQAGDIVKGGKQDRVLSNDMVLAPGSGKVGIAAFCVEQGRWSRRGGESSREFHSSSKKLASKELRLAARLKRKQSEVWREVAKVQDKLAASVHQNVKARASASSLQLTLENKQLAYRISTYSKSLVSLLNNKQHVVGYAFAINGQLNTADIFANQALMKKLWPKIVEAAATEAVAAYDKTLRVKSPTAENVHDWLEQAGQGHKTSQRITSDLTQETMESDKYVRFDSYSGKGNNKKLYRQSYITK